MTSYRYAWRHGLRWVRWDLEERQFIAALRQAWLRFVRGYIGETCQLCGRSYLLWHADDALYSRVTGIARPDGDNAAGLFCLACFDAMAQRQGIALRWLPTPLTAALGKEKK